MKHKISKILYATGLGEMAPRGFRYALAVAKQTGAEVLSLHVVEKFSYEGKMTLAENFTKEERRELLRRTMRADMEEMLNRDNKLLSDPELAGLREVKASNEVVHGVPEDRILQVATEIGADLIIVNAHQKGRINKNMIGSVARRVLRRSQIPVTVFPIPKK